MNIKCKLRTWGPYLLLLLLVVGLAGYQRQSERQAQLDANLIAAVHSHDQNSALDALAQGANPNARDYDHPAPTLWERVQYPAAAKEDDQGHAHDWEPVLMSAVISSYDGAQNNLNDRIVQALLKRGANVNTRDSAGGSILQHAALEGRLDWVTDILNRGAISAVSGSLSDAIISGNTAIVRLLISRGADVNAQDDQKFTPLTEACLLQNTAMARFLLDHGAILTLRDGRKQTALQMELSRRHKDPTLIHLLQQYGARKPISSPKSRFPS